MNSTKNGMLVGMLAGAAAALALLSVGGCTHLPQAAPAEFYLSPDGDDGADGTLERPWRTLAHARDRIRQMNQSMRGDIVVYLRGGVYRLEEPFVLGPSDSGTNGYWVRYRAYANERPVLSGGVRVTGWRRHQGDIWKAPLKRDRKLRALYVNGKRAVMARKSEGVVAQGGYGTFEITGQEPWARTSGSHFAGIQFRPQDVGVYRNPQNVELVQSNVWSEPIVCVKEMFSEDGWTVAVLQQPYGAIAMNMKWVPFRATPRPDRPLFVRNAYELLDEPGEFYFDQAEQMLYYYSRGEEMTAAKVYAPSTEGLVRIEGRSRSQRVRNIELFGLTFAHDDYLLSSLGESRGWVSVQSLTQFTRYIQDGNWHRNHYNDITIPKGTVNVCNAESIRLERNRFEHLGSAVAVNLENDVADAAVVGNVFTDLMGTSVNVGHPQHYKIGDGEQFPEGVEGVCREILISNNFVRDVCLDFRQVEGMTGFFAENVRIVHNEISRTPYGGLALGWWWGNAEIPPSKTAKNNAILYNRIGQTHQVLRDGGILYVLGEQPGSEIAFNYLYDGPRCIYPDDGSAYWRIHHNVVWNRPGISDDEQGLWLHIWTPACHDLTVERNFVKADRIRCEGTRCRIADTVVESDAPPWSAEAQAIIESAGLEPAYEDIRGQTETD
jgi:hypothetical protein